MINLWLSLMIATVKLLEKWLSVTQQMSLSMGLLQKKTSRR